MSSLRRDALLTLLSQAGATVLGIVSGILVARAVGPLGKGVFAVFQVDAQLATQLFGLSLPVALTYFVAARGAPLDRLLAAALAVWVASGVAFALVGIAVLSLPRVVAVLLPAGFDGPRWSSYVLALFLVQLVTAMLMAVAQGRRDFGTVNASAGLVPALLCVVYVILYVQRDHLGQRATTSLVLASFLAVQVLQLVLWILLHGARVGIWPGVALGWGETARVLRRLLAYGLLAHASSLTQFLNHRLDVWVVGYFRGVYDVGVYAAAVGVAQLLLLTSQSLAGVLLPHLTSASSERSEEMLRTASRMCIGAGAVLVLTLFIGGGWVITIFYGDAFSASGTSLRLLLPGALAAMMTRVYSAFLAARDCMRYNLGASAAGLVVTVVLDLLLIPRLGINGAALATTASYVTTFAVCVWVVRFRLGVRLGKAFMPSRVDLSIAWEALRAARRRANA